MEFNLDLRQGEFFQAEDGHYRKTNKRDSQKHENARRIWETTKIQVLVNKTKNKTDEARKANS